MWWTGFSPSTIGPIDTLHAPTFPRGAAIEERAGRFRSRSERCCGGYPSYPTSLTLSEPRFANQVGKDILRLADEGVYDHVVTGHHETGRIGRAILDSAPETVVRAAETPCPISP